MPKYFAQIKTYEYTCKECEQTHIKNATPKQMKTFLSTMLCRNCELWEKVKSSKYYEKQKTQRYI